MKTIFISLLILITFNSFSQKIVLAEIDKFTNSKRVETDDVIFYGGSMDWKKLTMKFRSVDTSYFLTLSGLNTLYGTIGTKDGLIFLFNDKSNITIYPTSVQTYNINPSQYGSSYTYSNQYYISKNEIEQLAAKKTIAVRRYFNENYGDVDIKEKKSVKINELATVFLNEINK